MRTQYAIAAMLLAASIATASTITFPEPIEVTATIRSVELAPVTFDHATGIYTVVATHKRGASEVTANGVAVAIRSQVHVTIFVTPGEQVAWLQANGMPSITAEDYADTPVSPALKTQMITAIAMAKALPVIQAVLEAEND